MGKSKTKKRENKKVKKNYSSHSESENEEKWIEKETPQKRFDNNWMQQDFLSGIKTVSTKDIKDDKKKQKNCDVENKLNSINQLGQHSKELNPYWKSGNKGLPPEKEQSSSFVPDAIWLQRSLKRMKEQSEKSERSLEDIAADRYGSWKAFQDMLDVAEKRDGINQSPDNKTKRRFIKPGEISSNKSTSKSRFIKPNDAGSSSTSSRKRFLKPQNTCNNSKLTDIPSWKKPKSDAKPNYDNSPKFLPSAKPVQKSSNVPQKPSTSEPQQPTEQVKGKILTKQEKNVIAAKLIKAELMGNTALIEKLNRKLQISEKLKLSSGNQESEGGNKIRNSSSSDEGETVVLTRTTRTGQSWPVTQSDMPLGKISKRRKNKKVLVHDKDGERERYFADDDHYSLKELVEREKTGAAEDHSQVMSRLSSKMFKGADGENFTLDDVFESETSRVNSQQQKDESHKNLAITKHKKLQKQLEKCKHCFTNSKNPKHLIIAVGEVSYLKLPSHRPLQPGHCIIAPMHHCVTATALDENVWSEIRKFMQSLCNMFREQGDDCVFIQTCINLIYSHHFFIECIPLPKELGDVAPIYFHKAIQECEGEWSQNKKLVDTRGKSVRDKIPVGLPYFAVDFAMDGGYAHVVEDEYKFPLYFGREILGGMLDADPQLWRKPKEEHFSDQTKRTLEFEKWYKEFNWTNTVT